MSGVATAAIGGTIVGGIIQGEYSKDASKRAARAQEKGTQAAIAEEQRQFDLQLEEYNRKQSILEKQYANQQRLLTPYIQSGQGALYELMALSGIAAPQTVEMVQDETGRYTARPVTQQPGMVSVLGAETGQPQKQLGGVAGAIQTAVGQAAGEARERRLPGIESMPSPYAGMTGEQAQQAAIQKISESPLLAEKIRAGEEALLQRASATGGLRGGNVQAALAQFRPQLLQEEIDKQYARLAGMSGTGFTGIQAMPVQQPGGVPTSGVPGMYQDIGAIQAGRIMSEAEATGKQWGDIATGVGYGIGRYLQQQPPATQTQRYV